MRVQRVVAGGPGGAHDAARPSGVCKAARRFLEEVLGGHVVRARRGEQEVAGGDELGKTGV